MPIWIEGELAVPSPQPHILEVARLRALQLLAGCETVMRPAQIRAQAVWIEQAPAARGKLTDPTWSAIERGTKSNS